MNWIRYCVHSSYHWFICIFNADSFKRQTALQWNYRNDKYPEIHI